MQPFNDSEEIAGIVRAFEECAISPDNFHHREHLAVAFGYCRQFPTEQAADQMRRGLRRFIAHNSLNNLYHETITLFWVKYVAAFCATADAQADSIAMANQILAHCNDSDLIRKYYTPALLNSEIARNSWQEPDLQSLQDV